MSEGIKITKLFRPYNGEQVSMAQIHVNNYDSSLSHIKKLSEILKKDFPGIKDEEIKIHKFGGQRVNGITFLEVVLDKNVKIPDGYFEVNDLELIR